MCVYILYTFVCMCACVCVCVKCICVSGGLCSFRLNATAVPFPQRHVCSAAPLTLPLPLQLRLRLRLQLLMPPFYLIASPPSSFHTLCLSVTPPPCPLFEIRKRENPRFTSFAVPPSDASDASILRIRRVLHIINITRELPAQQTHTQNNNNKQRKQEEEKENKLCIFGGEKASYS